MSTDASRQARRRPYLSISPPGFSRTRHVGMLLERPPTEGELSGEQTENEGASDRRGRPKARSRETAEHQEQREDPTNVPRNADRVAIRQPVDSEIDDRCKADQ